MGEAQLQSRAASWLWGQPLAGRHDAFPWMDGWQRVLLLMRMPGCRHHHCDPPRVQELTSAVFFRLDLANIDPSRARPPAEGRHTRQSQSPRAPCRLAVQT